MPQAVATIAAQSACPPSESTGRPARPQNPAKVRGRGLLCLPFGELATSRSPFTPDTVRPVPNTATRRSTQAARVAGWVLGLALRPQLDASTPTGSRGRDRSHATCHPPRAETCSFWVLVRAQAVGPVAGALCQPARRLWAERSWPRVRQCVSESHRASARVSESHRAAACVSVRQRASACVSVRERSSSPADGPETCPWPMVDGRWSMALGPVAMVHGPWSMGHGPGPQWCQGPSIRGAGRLALATGRKGRLLLAWRNSSGQMGTACS